MAGAQAPDVPVISGGIYVLRPLVSPALCLEVQGAGSGNGSLAGTWDFLQADHQRWRFLDAGNGCWWLEPVHAPGERLEMAAGAATNSTSARIWDATANPQQRWQILVEGGGAYRLSPQSAPGSCLSVQDGMSSRGAKVWQWQTTAGAVEQLWKIECETPLLDNAVYHFSQGSSTGVVAQAPGPVAAPGPGSEIRLGTFNGAALQKWMAVDEGSGWWSFSPSNALDLRLEVPGGSSSAGVQPWLETRTGTSAQKWRVHSLGDGQYLFQPQCAPQMCLGAANGQVTNAAPVVLQPVSNAVAAGWTITRDANVGSPAMLGTSVQIISGVYRAPIEVVRTNFLLWIDRDRLMYPYYLHGGLPYDPAKTNYGGWFGDGSLDVAGMWLSGAARSFAQGGSSIGPLKVNADYCVSKMAAVQQANGCIIWPPTFEMQAFQNGTFYATNPPWAGSYWYLVFPGESSYQMQWYWWEKIIGGLMDAWRYEGNSQALLVASNYCGYVAPYLLGMSTNKCQEMLKVDSGNLSEQVAMMAQLTGRPDFRSLARKLVMEPNLQAYADGLDTAVGQHGNTTVPRFTGAARVYQLTGEDYLRSSADNFFTKMTRDHCYAYGGLTDWEDISAGEPLGTVNTEGCVTHQMCRLARNLSETGMKVDYADYIENATLNQILGGIDENGSAQYYNSCEPGHMKLFGSRTNSFWCDTQRGWDDPGRHAEYIYSAGYDTLWVNLFVPSTVRWLEQGFVLRQETQFPVGNTSTLTIASAPPKELSLKIRIPKWVNGSATIQVSGQAPQSFRPGGYAHLRRVWSYGTTVSITLPMSSRARASRNGVNQLTFFYGPVMLAADLGPIGMDDHLQGDPRAVVNGAVPNETRVAPLLCAAALAPDQVLAPVAGEPLTFVTRPGVLRGGTYGQVILRPFYSIIHRHHNIYWDVQTTAGPVANGVYKILARHDGKVLQVANGGTTNGAITQQWTYNGGVNQQWALTSLGNNQYQILGVPSGRVIDVAGASTADGANVWLWDWLNGNNQKWTLTATSNGYYSVRAVHSGKALDVAGVSTADGAQVWQWSYLGGQNQQWTFVPVAPQAPKFLHAIGGVGQVRLDWDAPLGATSYIVKRAAASGGPYVVVATVASPVFVDTAVTNELGYYYVVSAVDSAGASGNSPEASASPHAAPALKTGATQGSQVQLAWPDWTTNWQLYAASNLAATAVWVPVTNAPQWSNQAFYVTVPVTGDCQFFRLASP